MDILSAADGEHIYTYIQMRNLHRDVSSLAPWTATDVVAISTPLTISSLPLSISFSLSSSLTHDVILRDDAAAAVSAVTFQLVWVAAFVKWWSGWWGGWCQRVIVATFTRFSSSSRAAVLARLRSSSWAAIFTRLRSSSRAAVLVARRRWLLTTAGLLAGATVTVTVATAWSTVWWTTMTWSSVEQQQTLHYWQQQQQRVSSSQTDHKYNTHTQPHKADHPVRQTTSTTLTDSHIKQTTQSDRP